MQCVEQSHPVFALHAVEEEKLVDAAASALVADAGVERLGESVAGVEGFAGVQYSIDECGHGIAENLDGVVMPFVVEYSVGTSVNLVVNAMFCIETQVDGVGGTALLDGEAYAILLTEAICT